MSVCPTLFETIVSEQKVVETSDWKFGGNILSGRTCTKCRAVEGVFKEVYFTKRN